MAPVNENTKTVVASETVIVHDDNLNIDRRVIAGQEVPPDLVEAYAAKTGDTSASPAKSGGDDEPYEGYGDASAADIVERLGTLSDDDVEKVKAYEKANKGRTTIAEYERSPA